MFAVGHLALGYIAGKITSKVFHVNARIPFLLALSVLPDIDLMIPRLAHRGPTHSVVTIALLFLPFFIKYRKSAIPYFAATIQHSLIGDFLTGGGTQLLWPIDRNWFGMQTSQMGTMNMLNEWVLFIVFVATMEKLGDLRKLMKPHHQNLLLIAPLNSIISPLLLGFPLPVPFALYIPHVVCAAVLSLSLMNDIKFLMKNRSIGGGC